MLDPFKDHLEAHGLCGPGDRILLAVSGGVDSVAMAHLFKAAGYVCAIAHCNFQLRGQESAGDESFVRSLAASLDIPVHVTHFDTEDWAGKEGMSIQMAARSLRYRWFEHLTGVYDLNKIATAHNLDDSVETFFLNLARGTGIRGLTGIPVRNRKVIRPLLFATRKMILAYAREHGLAFREDSSNLDTKYQRNKIRHNLIPVMEQVSPAFVDIMGENMKRLKEIHAIFREAVENRRQELFRAEGDRIRIPVSLLKELKPRDTWFYELFSPYGFTRSQCASIARIMNAPPGKQSHSGTHQLYKDRQHLILLESREEEFERYYLDSPEKRSLLPFPMDVEVIAREEMERIPDDPMVACLDYDTIQFPLTIRRWLPGDYFCPLGMEQTKKVSDFFVDRKIPVPEKRRIWLLASGRKIVWIMGQRIDHRFRITDHTRTVLLLRIQSDVPAKHAEEGF